ncbi:DEAD/DEAH box helicase [Deinococcus pimensis]|uniref:DEAD/DEAH box helicase n=1 Tax=Deinococcus pimensis TaxID=309888 RepID=UPI0004BACA42|nr:DEAD/DEAH box helicase [Deinococcus pimensis]
MNAPLLTVPPVGIKLRDYQANGIQRVRALLAQGKRRVLLTAPTGTGKMVFAAEIIRRAVERGGTALFVAHRRELIQQCSDKLTLLGVRHGLILPGHKPSNLEQAFVGTVPSYRARLKAGSFDPLNVTVIVTDECHHATAATYRDLYDRFPNAVHVGLTATPTRTDGAGLGDVYEELVQAITYAQAFEANYLVRPRYYAPSNPDLEGVRTVGGDYSDDDLEAVMNRPQIVGDIVTHFARLAGDRQGIVFATTVRHSIALRDAFVRAGINAMHIDGTTPTDVRDELMAAFRAGEYQVTTNVAVATEGLDVPNIGVVVMARPTKSPILHLQCLGRGLRPSEGKDHCLVLDHAGNTLRLGPVEEYETWTLETGKGANTKKRKPAEPRDPKEVTCEACCAIFFGSKVCPACGHVHARERAPQDVDVLDGELTEFRTGRREKVSLEEKRTWYRMLLGLAAAWDKKPGWAYYAYRARFGVSPIWGSGTTQPMPASPEVIAWATKYRREARRAWKAQQDAQASQSAGRAW